MTHQEIVDVYIRIIASVHERGLLNDAFYAKMEATCEQLYAAFPQARGLQPKPYTPTSTQKSQVQQKSWWAAQEGGAAYGTYGNNKAKAVKANKRNGYDNALGKG